MSEELADKLITQIEDAFAEVKYPGDRSIGRPDEIASFVGKHWRDVPLQSIVTQRHLRLFTPEGLRFYLPAYLIAIIKHPYEVDTLVDSIVDELSPPPRSPWKSQEIRIGADFQPEERRAIRAFFEAYKDIFPQGSWSFSDSARESLERAIIYWQR